MGFWSWAGPVIDPANFFGKRDGGISIANAIDPGGAMIEGITGSDFARQIADPLDLLSALEMPSFDAMNGIDGSSATYASLSPTYPSTMTNRIGNTIAEGIFVGRCYGTCKIGGNKIRFNDADATDVRIIVGHCIGEVSGISRWEINDLEWSLLDGTHTKTEYKGNRTQTADGRFSDRASGYRSIAYTAFTFEKDDMQVGYSPNITVVMSGLLCLPLVGGAKAHTRNPAVILYDWYLNVEGYSAGELDLNAFKSLEALCNEVPTGSSLPRYRFDFNLDVNMAINDAKKLIWSSFNGLVIQSQGTLKPIWDSGQIEDGSGGLTSKTVSHAFDLDNIVKDSFVWKQIERPNVVRVHFIDSDNNYKRSSVEIKDQTDILVNGEILFEEQCWYITNEELARRRAKFKFNKKQYTDYSCSFAAFSGAGDIEVLDLVTITHTLPGWTAKQFLIASRGEDEQGKMSFTAVAYYPGAYDDSQVGVQASYESALPNPFVAVAVTSPALVESGFVAGDGSYVPFLTLTFTKPSSPFWFRGQIFVSTDAGASYTFYGNATDGLGYRIEAGAANYEEGNTVYAKVLSENNNGAVQKIADVTAITEYVDGKKILPSNVTGFSASQIGDIVIFVANRPSQGTDADFSHFELRQGASWSASQLISTYTQTKYPLTDFTAGTKTYMIKAVDTSGNKSLTETQVVISLTAPSTQNIFYSQEKINRIEQGTAYRVARNYKSAAIAYITYNQDISHRLAEGTAFQVARNYVFEYAYGFFVDGTETMDDAPAEKMDDSGTDRMWTPGYGTGYFETEAADVGLVSGKIYLDLITTKYDGATKAMQYKTSTDGVTYGSYASFTDGVFGNFRYIIFKIAITIDRASYPESNMKIWGLRVTINKADSLGAGFFIDGTEKMSDSLTDTMDDSTTERMWTPGYNNGYLITEAVDVGLVTGKVYLDLITTGYIGAEYSIEYKTSTDGTTYTGFSSFPNGVSETFRYIIFKISLSVGLVNYPQSNIKVTSLLLSVDLPTITNTGANKTVGVGGTTITFDTQYVSASSIRIKINVVSATALISTHELKTITNFKAHVFDTGGNNTGGVIDYEATGF